MILGCFIFSLVITGMHLLAGNEPYTSSFLPHVKPTSVQNNRTNVMVYRCVAMNAVFFIDTFVGLSTNYVGLKVFFKLETNV